MNLNERILALENKIIDVFTIFTWWTEVRFDKDNLYWSVTFAKFYSIFFACMFFTEIPSAIEQKSYQFVIFAGIVGVGNLFFFLMLVTKENFSIGVLRRNNPQGMPNPCRISVGHSTRRRIVMFLLLVIICLFVKVIVVSAFLVHLTLGTTCFFISEFLIACDSLPPAEKERKLANNELSRLHLARVFN